MHKMEYAQDNLCRQGEDGFGWYAESFKPVKQVHEKPTPLQAHTLTAEHHKSTWVKMHWSHRLTIINLNLYMGFSKKKVKGLPSNPLST